MGTTTSNKPGTQAARERAVEDAIHSASMEGLTVTPATRADADEYAAGAIDVDELIARVDARHRVG
jgi:hypothetical protein